MQKCCLIRNWMNEYEKKKYMSKVILWETEVGPFVTEPVYDPCLFKRQLLKH